MTTFGLCVESSHKKGMGHFFRVLNFAHFLKSKNKRYIVFINDDKNSVSILEEKGVDYEIVDLNNFQHDWESFFIKKYNIDIWINDRLDTDIRHSKNIKKNNIELLSFDDRGSGADMADINFGSLPFNFSYNLKGKKVCKGIKYLILNKEIDKVKRERKGADRIVVTFGGSDTYGVTIKIIKILKRLNKKATIISGPSFLHDKELENVIDTNFIVKKNVPSLIEELCQYDLAITSGGVTPFEANASGLPCIIISNEINEIDNGVFLNDLGSSVFAGYRTKVKKDIFTKDLDIEMMSKKGLSGLQTNGAMNVYNEMERYG